MAIIKRQEISTAKNMEKSKSLCIVRNVKPLRKIVWRFCKNLKNVLLYDPLFPLLGIYPKKVNTLTQKDIYTLMFTAVLFAIGKIWKQPKYSSKDEWKRRCDMHMFAYIVCIYIHIHTYMCIHIYVHTHIHICTYIYVMEYTHTHTHTSAMETLPLVKAKWKDLEDIILNEISQTEKEKYHMISIICGI